MITTERVERRLRIKDKVRRRVQGTPERPRLSIFRSLNHIYAQIIDDFRGHTVVAASSLDKEFNDLKTHKGNVKMAQKVGELIAKKALEKGIKRIVFDRSGYLYHGSVKAIAEAARDAGLEF